MKIWNEILLIDKLRKEHKLTAEEYKILLECQDSNCLSYLQKQAQEEALSRFGNRVFIRGLIEVTNRCRNNCYYCGIRKGNPSVSRYGLFPDCAITLSLGEKTRETYERFFHAGANRYLLRHETYNKEHYRLLHPDRMSPEYRLQCLQWLKEIGYQTGTGIMVGTPGQTIGHLVEDLLFIERFQPEMIGIGPFIPHHDTPFAGKAAGSMEMTLKLLSIFRLMHPYALIPSTTALATLASDGRERGILAGANVVMPNLSPPEQRTKYTLYDNKAAFGAEAAEGLKKLSERLNAIGYRISTERGDYNGNRT